MPSSGALSFYRKFILSYRSAHSYISASDGHVISCTQPNDVSAAHRHYSRIARNYSLEVTTSRVVTHDYTVTTRFSRCENIRNRRSGWVLTTRNPLMQLSSGNRGKRIFRQLSMLNPSAGPHSAEGFLKLLQASLSHSICLDRHCRISAYQNDTGMTFCSATPSGVMQKFACHTATPRSTLASIVALTFS